MRSAAPPAHRRGITPTSSPIFASSRSDDSRLQELRLPPGNVLPGRMSAVPPSSFDLLARLLQDVTPHFAAKNGPVPMTVGEPQDPPPQFVTDIIAARG